MILATRGSRLALAQAELVRKKLRAIGVEAELLPVTTRGDREQSAPLREIGGDGLFIRELEKKLLSGEADAAIHSGKDLPFELHPALCIAGAPDAADPRDCLLTVEGVPFPACPVIGTGSPRRILQYRALNPGAVYREIRGNIDTRIQKLRNGEYDGILLARAGIDRLMATEEATGELLTGIRIDTFSEVQLLPAPCQGILAAECRIDDEETITVLRKITEEAVRQRFEAERCLFQKLHADCRSAVGVYACVEQDRIKLRAMLEGRHAEQTGNRSEYRELCAQLCTELRKECGEGDKN